jgi:hypothetical protein
MVRKRHAAPRWLVLIALPLMPGCAFGPYVLENTHGKYHESVKRVQDEEFLRNLVRIRYSDSWSSLDVASITAQYELGAGAEARPFFQAPNPTNNGMFRRFNSVLPDVSVSGANNPTISLVPKDDTATLQRLLRPMTAEGVLFFAESGWPITSIFRIWVDSMNKVPNAETARGSGSSRSRIPDYQRYRRVTRLLQNLEESGGVTFAVDLRTRPLGAPLPAEKMTAETQIEAVKNSLEYVPGTEPQTWTLARRERKLNLKVHPQAVGSPEIMELCDLLWLQPGLTQYDVTVGAVPPYPDTFPPPRLTTIDIAPRSPIQALLYMSNGVSVPPDHIAQGLANSTVGPDGLVFDWQQVTAGFFTVCSVKQHKRPEHAYVSVRYRDYWFYIDERDQASKISFNLMLQLTRLDLSGGSTTIRQSTPLLTLPIGR